MTSPAMKARLAAGETLVGCFAGLGSALAVEILGLAGLDWVLVDLEHGGGHEGDLVPQLLAARATGAHALVRVEATEQPRVGRALDLGAEGVMFPRVDTVEQATAAVRALRYGPEGGRGVATYNRACAFGLQPEAIDEARDRTLGVVQIESPAAVEAAAAIAAVDGVDALFIGPMDLSHAMGIRGQVDAPAFREAVAAVIAATQRAGKAAGILLPSADAVPAAMADGFRMIGVGSDAALLMSAARAVAGATRP